jgi:hypothetical protein
VALLCCRYAIKNTTPQIFALQSVRVHMKAVFVLLLIFSPSCFGNEFIADATGGKFDSEKGKYQDEYCGEVEYKIEIVDLNHDGSNELFVHEYGTCMGGITGMSIDLLIKSKGGWISQFGFPGDYEILKEANLGFPDIMITGRGFCFPVWRWNGEKYQLNRKQGEGCEH